MRIRLRYLLPVVQILIAIALYAWSDATFREMRRHSTGSGTTIGFTILMSLNAPLALPRGLYYGHAGISELYDRVVLFLGITLLWYWVGRNLESWKERRTVLFFRWLPLRISTDIILIAYGGFWFFVVIRERLWHTMSLPDPAWIWIAAVFTPVVTWATALVFFFGRDLLQAVRDKTPPCATASLS